MIFVNDMDYLKRKKEQAHLITTASYMNGFLDRDIFGKVQDGWRGKTEIEIDKLIDQVYKRGLKDGRKG